MRKKVWKKSRAILPLLLSAIMIVEPIGMATTVYAGELAPMTETVGSEQDKDAGEGTDDKEQETNDGVKDNSEGNADDQGDGEDAKDAERGDEGSDSDKIDKNNDPSEDSSETEDAEGQKTDQDDEDEEIPDDETLEQEEKEDADAEDTVSDNDLEEEEENAELNGFQGMPSSYKLTAEQIENKRSVAEHIGEISGFEEGENYAKGEVVTLVESQEEAEMIAKAYNAEIEDFEYGVLTLKLDTDVSVEMAVKVAADMDTNMPAVWPNYYRYLLEEEPVSDSSTVEIGDGIEIETTEYDVEERQESVEEASYLAAVTDAYLKPESGCYQWHHTVIGSPYAWAAGYTGRDIKVAVLDSGVASNNDLTDINYLSSNNGTTDTSKSGHGTHVTGIIGARTDRGPGVGVAPEVTLYSYNLGEIKSADIMAGINAASGAEGSQVTVDIINMSIGGLGYVKDEQTCVNNAYNKGVAIFASAGNDGGQTYSYPACYDHVISVAATDKTNQRASFSTYCNKVDLSAPGVAIWSTSKAGGDAYVSMSGTSMACPVAAGEAAVILSDQKFKDMEKNGKKVDALEKLMKKNAVKAGSGMGAGITSLTKVFGLSTAATKPKAPVITITPDGEAKTQQVTVTIKAQSGTTIYYTKSGKNPSYKNGVVDVKAGTTEYDGPFTINDRAIATIKAIAVNDSGVSSAVKSVKYTLKPYVTNIEISGLKQVAPGKSIQLSAKVTPTYATNKQVTWALKKSDNSELTAVEKKNLKIAANGKVTATAKATPGTYKVVVKAKDRGEDSISAEYVIEVIAGVKVRSVKFLDSKNKVLKNVSLILPDADKKTYDLRAVFKPEGMSSDVTPTAADFNWTSSNTSIVTVSDVGVVTAVKSGKATITALAKDSSGKKATVTVTVTQLVEELSISGPAKLAPTKSATFKATVEPTWVTNKKVTWEIYAADETKIDTKNSKAYGVSINAKNGKVTTTKTAKEGTYTVKATTQDAAKKDATTTFVVTGGIINKLTFSKKADANVKVFRKTTAFTTNNVGSDTVIVEATIDGTNGADLSQYTVSNSNVGIATFKDTSAKGSGKITLEIKATGKTAGKTKITIASTDGSNKKLTCNVTVINPVSAVTIAPPAGNNGCLVRGKSLQLKARVESENGAISNKNVTWELYQVTKSGSSNVLTKVDSALEKELGIKISTGGKVTANKKAKLNNGKETVNGQEITVEIPTSYVVQATAKDGSGVYDRYWISMAQPATKLDIYFLNQKVTSGKYGFYMAPEGKVWPFEIYSPDLWQGGFTVSSSNPAVASVTYEPDTDSNGNSYVNSGTMYVATYKKGTVTFTVKAMDGSGKQAKVTMQFR